MTVRPFDWRDLPALHRYRSESVYLDSALVLTRGPLLVSSALLSYLAPALGISTGVSVLEANGRADPPPLIGQIMHPNGAPLAHLTFLTPAEPLEAAALHLLLDYLAIFAGERGACRLVADIDEGSPAFNLLHRAGFAIYGRQRTWQWDGAASENQPLHLPPGWRAAVSADTIPLRSLYNNLVPGLVQGVEPLTAPRLKGLVYRQGDEVRAFIELKYGHRGIWMQPFIHPDADAEAVAEQLGRVIVNLPYRRGRPIYICVRSYQSWLEAAIDDFGAEAGPRQAVMVKHLALPLKAARTFSLPVLEAGHAEASAPMVRSERTTIYGTTQNYR
jgi:hypothetical protein